MFIVFTVVNKNIHYNVNVKLERGIRYNLYFIINNSVKQYYIMQILIISTHISVLTTSFSSFQSRSFAHENKFIFPVTVAILVNLI